MLSEGQSIILEMYINMPEWRMPERTLFVIITDGEENASRYYSAKKVKGMIERQKSRYGWEFLFLGANIDAVQTAGRFGISEDRAVNYNCDSRGTMLNYRGDRRSDFCIQK